METFDSQHTDELATLVALADQGSFAAAGRLLARHPSVLSKRMQALERRLGVRLVERTTRQLHFTNEGWRLVEKLRQAAHLIRDAEQEAAQGAQEIRGRLRLSMPATMGRRWISPMLADFSLAYPEVALEVEYSERIVDIVGERFDAAIRIGNLADSRLVATRLCDQQACTSRPSQLPGVHRPPGLSAMATGSVGRKEGRQCCRISARQRLHPQQRQRSLASCGNQRGGHHRRQ